ncbi:MAG: dihydropteroate synthase [Gemmatales bacterium]|nr:dihydropteroate synthase [Gemmatales bacterium]MDW8386519.1 dihydropteroate synthase [Gemmatales bacterium]
MNEHLWQLPDRTVRIGLRPLIMGIVNVTPDSFSDGGQWLDPDRAVAHGLDLVEQGADLLDIGGESTRPGADPVPLEEELRRVLPVIERLAKAVTVPISIDTYKAETARQALAAGASIINDVTALTGDPAMLEVAAQSQAALLLMHMQGTPKTMQINPQYTDVVGEVYGYLEERLAVLARHGIGPQRVAVDPGIGFGKRLDHNLDLLAHVERFQKLGRPVCLGVSRKGFINRVLGRPGWVETGNAGTLGVLLYAMSRQAVQIARVHDVAAAHAAITLFAALAERGSCHAGTPDSSV